jgi:hypothetical protein
MVNYVYEQGLQENADMVQGMCPRCHAPAAFANQTADTSSTDFTCGVQCTVCHLINEVPMPCGNGCYTLCNDGQMRACLLFPQAPHGAKFSGLHDSAALCGGCHNLKNMKGAQLMATGMEWMNGPAGKQEMPCQRCHMPAERGRAARRCAVRDDVHPHGWAGSTDREMREKALTLGATAAREADTVTAHVEVTNSGAGHAVPSGMGPRCVVLTCALVDAEGNTLDQKEQRYQRMPVDDAGKPAMPWSATKMQCNTIGAGCTVEHDFELTVPAGAGEGLKVVCTLTYHWAPPEMLEADTLAGKLREPALMAEATAIP